MPQPDLHAERIFLRMLRESDFPEVAYLRSDPKVNRYVHRPPAKTTEDALAFIEKIRAGVNQGSNYYWVIAAKEEDRMIGSICLWNFSEEGKHAEIGYDLHPDHQHRGFMSEAMKCVLEFAFHTLHLAHVEAFTHRDNERSIHLLKKHGFRWIPDRVDADNVNNVIFFLDIEGFKTTYL